MRLDREQADVGVATERRGDRRAIGQGDVVGGRGRVESLHESVGRVDGDLWTGSVKSAARDNPRGEGLDSPGPRRRCTRQRERFRALCDH